MSRKSKLIERFNNNGIEEVIASLLPITAFFQAEGNDGTIRNFRAVVAGDNSDAASSGNFIFSLPISNAGAGGDVLKVMEMNLYDIDVENNPYGISIVVDIVVENAANTQVLSLHGTVTTASPPASDTFNHAIVTADLAATATVGADLTWAANKVVSTAGGAFKITVMLSVLGDNS